MMYPLFKLLEAATDAASKGLITIDEAHHDIHDGVHFTVNYVMTTATSATVLITNPSTGGYVHLIPFVEISDKTASHTWTVSKDPGASGGSVLTAINNYIGHENQASVVFTNAPTFVSTGTILETHYIGAGNSSPFSVRGEWVMPPDSTMMIRASTGASAPVSFNLYFDEHM